MASTFSLAPDFWDTASNAVSAALEWEVKKSSSPGESCMYGVGWGGFEWVVHMSMGMYSSF